MNSLIVLTLVSPFCLAIEVDFYDSYGVAIKKIEIPSCKTEPCDLVKGTPLNITLIVESRYPPGIELNEASDLESFVGINGYRDNFVYDLAQRTLLCDTEPNQCPIRLNTLYEIERQLLLSSDKPEDEQTVFGSKNGLTKIFSRVIMLKNKHDGTVIGGGYFNLNIKPNL